MADHAVSNSVHATRRHGAHDSGLDVDAKDDTLSQRLRDLEEENSVLAEKATSASQRFADYENEIRVLQTRLREKQQRQKTSESDSPTLSPDRPSLSRLGSFMRKPSLVPMSIMPYSPTPREQELEATLAKEQTARIEAEKKTRQMSIEVEELSTSLFQQANDMVATERKENAALKDRIHELESVGSEMGDAEDQVGKENDKLKQKIKVLEQRDRDRQKRLERLEAAQKRIDRVRTMLVPR